ncbi:RNA-binding S4 domain-containing protein [Horticoccus luteus]|uniref:RNA-binding S4 domain-containing protein n=1 Tax=Horticoccus luteus TaxID=2862869 RepID=A0A8F9TVP7_9BACT|nr:S4 domain-containing protein [Horticoccus luteus]QYM78634.1 RNA-binding S4 domain-containing protein [Horticoccus luteus]
MSDRQDNSAGGGSAARDDGPRRLDRWLWGVRIFKTRAAAAEACRAGDVAINDVAAKPAREVRIDETIRVRQGLVTRTLVVRGAPRSRVGAALVAGYCEETTPAEEWEKAKVQRVQQVMARPPGAGRPTKRDRRRLEELWGD